MNDRETTYRKMFDAWDAGEHAYALELSRVLLHDFPDFEFGLVLQGVILYELARYEEAEQVLRAAVQDLSTEAKHHGYLQLGHLFRDKGDYDSAEKWYRQSMELNPNDAGRHIFLGLVLAKKGHFHAAEEEYRQGTKCTKGAIDEAYLNLALILRAQERYKEALECIERALALTPDYPEPLKVKKDLEKTLAYLRTGE